ncbi:MAG: DinB family protein [Acidobacteria bacterium]|nr:DinB family protein [Acidobacteriota bacterium]
MREKRKKVPAKTQRGKVGKKQDAKMPGETKEELRDRIEQIIAELKRTADDATEAFGALDLGQLNWKPGEKSWSVAQCLDHLILTNEQFYPEFDKLASGTRKNTFWQNNSPFTGFFGRFLIRAVTEDSKKAKAPSKNIVPPSELPSDIVDRFAANIADVCGRITNVADADREKVVVSSPFLSLMTYKLDDAFTVLVEHTKRHIRQAKRVVQANGFPI